jgi:3-hydroxyisobutyrate dehydrogenase-like beta-hydroxyacid dehydrogenase
MVDSICFIGLGSMGLPIARNLLKTGTKLFVYNRSKEKAEDLVAQGAELLNSPLEAFERSKIVFSMVSNDQALQTITEGSYGLLKNAHPGCIHISMSTISPTLSRSLAEKHREKGTHYLASPVFGRPDVAEKQKLWICLAGDKGAKKQVLPFLQHVGQKVYDFGEKPEIANAVKLTGNFMILASVELLAEAFAFAEKNGVPLNIFHTMLTESLFPSPVFENYGKIILNQDFFPAGFKMSLGLKDIDLFLRTADSLRVPSPIAGLLHDRLMTGLAHNREDLDWSAIALTSTEEAGLVQAEAHKE